MDRKRSGSIRPINRSVATPKGCPSVVWARETGGSMGRRGL